MGREDDHMGDKGNDDGLTPGQLLRHLREYKGWDQAELAKRSGVSVRSIGQYERDQVKTPTTATLLPIARAIGGMEAVDLLRAWGFHDDAEALARRQREYEAGNRRADVEQIFLRVMEELGLRSQSGGNDD